MSPRSWLVIGLALLILAVCAVVEYVHQRRDKRGKVEMRRHLGNYDRDGWGPQLVLLIGGGGLVAFLMRLDG